jgi:hypothetical protein
MALRSAAAQAATLLRLRGARPASLWVPLARRFSATPFASDGTLPCIPCTKFSTVVSTLRDWVNFCESVRTVCLDDFLA